MQRLRRRLDPRRARSGLYYSVGAAPCCLRESSHAFCRGSCPRLSTGRPGCSGPPRLPLTRANCGSATRCRSRLGRVGPQGPGGRPTYSMAGSSLRRLLTTSSLLELSHLGILRAQRHASPIMQPGGRFESALAHSASLCVHFSGWSVWRHSSAKTTGQWVGTLMKEGVLHHSPHTSEIDMLSNNGLPTASLRLNILL